MTHESKVVGYLTHARCVQHEMDAGHPESPARLEAIQRELQTTGLWARLQSCEAPEASRAQIERAHDAEYVELLMSRIPQQGYAALDGDTEMNPHSWNAALRAAGAVVEATDRVMSGAWQRAFCAVRPPGHHAMHARAMGFCLLNNIAIGARHALHAHGLKRVAVVDFDVHHGNGSEDILAGDEGVLMVGLFQHPFYPYSGTDQAANNMVNVPLPAGTSGKVLRQVVEQIWLPRLHAFAPELLFISAGFDAHRADPLGQMDFVEDDYAWVTQQLVQVAQTHAQGRIVSSLEGGYHLQALAKSVAAHMEALLG